MRRNKEDGGSTDESKCQSENVGRTSDDSLSVWVVDSTSEFMEAHWATLRFLTRCFPVLGLLWWLRSSNCYRRYDSLPEYLESTPENEINTRKLRGFVVHLDVKSGYIHVLHTPLLRRIFGIHPSDANLEHHTLKVSMAFVRTVPQYSEEATRAFEEALLRKFITLQFVDLSKSSKNKNPRCIIWKRPGWIPEYFRKNITELLLLKGSVCLEDSPYFPLMDNATTTFQSAERNTSRDIQPLLRRYSLAESKARKSKLGIWRHVEDKESPEFLKRLGSRAYQLLSKWIRRRVP